MLSDNVVLNYILIWLNGVHGQEVTTDPLEQYCNDVPEADECRVYED